VSGISIAVADEDGEPATFTLSAISLSQVTQSRSLSNPSWGTSTLVFDNGGSEGHNQISVSLSGGNRLFGIADRVNLQLNQTLRCMHGSNLSSGTVINGVISGEGNLELSGLRYSLRLTNINLYEGDTIVFGENSGFTGVDVWNKSLYVDGLANEVGSTTGRGCVILQGSASGIDFHKPFLRGCGIVGYEGREGITLTLGSTSSDVRSFPQVSPGGILNNNGSTTETIGTLTVNGDVEFTKGSGLSADVSGDGSADLLVINGTLLLDGTDTILKVSLLDGDSEVPARMYELARYKERTGRFSTVELDEVFGDDYRVIYDLVTTPGYKSIVVSDIPFGTLLFCK
jgi:hypothetical protein